MGLKEKLMKWWYLGIRNTTVRKGEAGGFRWRFRKFSVDFETLSGNFKMRFTADAHPYGALISRTTEDDIHGFAFTIYEIGKLLTTDQKFVNDIEKAIRSYGKRLDKLAAEGVVEDETEEKIALETEKQIQEVVDMPKNERRKYSRDVDRRFEKAVKEVEKHEAED